MNRALLAAAGVLMAAGCSSSKGAAPVAATADSLSLAPTSLATAAPIASSPSVAPVLAAGTATEIRIDAGADFRLTVGQPIAVATLPATANLFVGVPVTIVNGSGPLSFDASTLGLGPVVDGSPGDDGSGIGVSALRTTACRGEKYLAAGIAAAARTGSGPDSGDSSIAAGATVTGCVVFVYTAADHPTTVGLYRDPPEEADGEQPYATWNVTMPSVPASAPTPAVGTSTPG